MAIVHRIARALVNLGSQRHPGRTVINLAPADLKKAAGGFDLPIALTLLIATGQRLTSLRWATMSNEPR